MVTEVKVGVSIGGTVQIVKYEYSETYLVEEARTYSGNWTDEEADVFDGERYAEMYARVEKKAQDEVDRLEALRERLNG